MTLVLRNPTQFSQPQASWAVSPGKFGALVEDVNWELEQYPQHPARFLSPHALCCQVYTHGPPPGRVYFSHFADEETEGQDQVIGGVRLPPASGPGAPGPQLGEGVLLLPPLPPSLYISLI